MGFSHFHESFSNPSPFKGEVRRGMGYMCRCSINRSTKTGHENRANLDTLADLEYLPFRFGNN
jgi:hypothetical protein